MHPSQPLGHKNSIKYLLALSNIVDVYTDGNISYRALSNMIVTRQMFLLSTWNVKSVTKELNF